MSWRILMVNHSSKLSFKDNGLHILRYETNEEFSVPLEDIAIVMMEDLKSIITLQAINALSQHNVAFVSCNQNHHPSGLNLPINGHYRNSHIAFIQNDVLKSTYSRLHQKIIQNKIQNQYIVLHWSEPEKANFLLQLSQKVKLADKDNAEAQAAAYYFKALFGQKFIRGDNDGLNAALNYGYTIFRALMARAIIANGLLAQFGIFHKNTFNSFNLVDDMMEVFRPIVDNFVKNHEDEIKQSTQLSPEIRQSLVGLLTGDILLGGQQHNIISGSILYAQSLVRSYKEQKAENLYLLEII